MPHAAMRTILSRPGTAAAACLVLLAAVAFLDDLTGVDLGFSLFYLLPVSLAAWRLGLWPGVAMAGVCAAVWFYVGHVLNARILGNPAAPYWNAAVRLGFFLVVAVLLDRLNKALALARQVARLKSQMMSAVSHEFGNALATISVVVTLLREPGNTLERRGELLAILERCYLNLRQTSGNLLDQARMEAGFFKLSRQRVVVRELLLEVVSALEPLGRKKGVALELVLPEQVLPVWADPAALRIVLANLIGNALKYTPKNGRVRVIVAGRGSPADSVEVRVEDDGIGIKPDEQEAVFSGYHRTEAARAAATGTGIGLRLSRDLLESHGAGLTLKSRPGEGSRFSFVLPIYREPAAA